MLNQFQSPKNISIEQRVIRRSITDVIFSKGKSKFHGANKFYNALVEWQITAKEKEFTLEEVLRIDPLPLVKGGLLKAYSHDKFLKRIKKNFPFLFEENVKWKYPMLHPINH